MGQSSPPGRNDPCWCGSGLKYKRCHLTRDLGGRGAGPGSRAAVDGLLLGQRDRDAMRRAGAFNAQLMDCVRGHVQPGVTTESIDLLVEEYTRDHGHVPACLGYRGFPRASCISPNEVVCHGIPGPVVLEEGDIVNVDLTTIVDGWHGDQSETFLLEPVSPQARSLVQVALDCLYLGIRAIRPGGQVVEIGEAISTHARKFGYGVVREYQGHGIGRRFHQDPDVPHYPTRRQGAVVLEPGMCFTVEPMINMGTWRTVLDRGDGWTVRTADGKLSAQFEHTVLLTEQGPEILTLTRGGPQEGHRF
jgi:methionyl aminopeptidase